MSDDRIERVRLLRALGDLGELDPELENLSTRELQDELNRAESLRWKEDIYAEEHYDPPEIEWGVTDGLQYQEGFTKSDFLRDPNWASSMEDMF